MNVDVIVSVLRQLCTPLGILYALGGGALGMVLGAIPGLSGGTASVIILPLTYKMNPGMAIALLCAIWVGSCSGGCIGAILLGIPGTNASIATVYDGYELTKQGNPVKALSAAVISNFIGTLPSLIVAMLLCPVITSLAIKLGPWEYFGLGLWAVTTVIALSEGMLAKGFISMALAMLLAAIGTSPVCGTVRFTFGNIYLLGGVNIITLLLGIFAGRMIMEEYARGTKTEQPNIKVDRFRFPKEDFSKNKGNVIRSFLTGLVIGFLPGMGGGVSNVLSYSMEKNLSKHPEKFGTGCIDGVIAPEVSNNATIGGALIPLISLGIPGSGALVYFITALAIHGISVGPLLSKTNPEIVSMIFLSAIIATIGILLAQTLGMPLFPKLLTAPYHYLYPAIIVVCFLGAYITVGNLSGLVIALSACLLGVFMGYFGIPTAPFMLTFVLSSMLETKLRQGITYGDYGWLDFFLRPLSCGLILLSVGSVLWNLFGRKIMAGIKAGRA